MDNNTYYVLTFDGLEVISSKGLLFVTSNTKLLEKSRKQLCGAYGIDFYDSRYRLKLINSDDEIPKFSEVVVIDLECTVDLDDLE